jgi:hypothetical protein
MIFSKSQFIILILIFFVIELINPPLDVDFFISNEDEHFENTILSIMN